MKKREVFFDVSKSESENYLSDRQDLKNYFITYFLLSDELLIHPAYIWQSLKAHEIIFNSLKLLETDFIKVILEPGQNVEDYILNRIEKVSRASENEQGTIKEKLGYDLFSRNIKKEIDIITAHLHMSGKDPYFIPNKDRKFRIFLYEDFSGGIEQKNDLRSLITNIEKRYYNNIELMKKIEELSEFALNHKGVSVSTSIGKKP